MKSQTPSLKYLSGETHRIIREISALRESEKIPVLYTMDAGPTVHLICTDDSIRTVREFAERQKKCLIFETKIGQGARIL
ncbi:hypothetical protein HYW84_02940 [Candidatus Peregrinibacteria bacterium]|nr:hypothetical protein [Candidatus Peregrinibacteria bacterium]